MAEVGGLLVFGGLDGSGAASDAGNVNGDFPPHLDNAVENQRLKTIETIQFNSIQFNSIQ